MIVAHAHKASGPGWTGGWSLEALLILDTREKFGSTLLSWTWATCPPYLSFPEFLPTNWINWQQCQKSWAVTCCCIGLDSCLLSFTDFNLLIAVTWEFPWGTTPSFLTRPQWDKNIRIKYLKHLFFSTSKSHYFDVLWKSRKYFNFTYWTKLEFLWLSNRKTRNF